MDAACCTSAATASIAQPLCRQRLVGQPAQGVHQTPAEKPNWQQIVISLRRSSAPLVVGGRTALELRALRITFARSQKVHLYGPAAA